MRVCFAVSVVGWGLLGLLGAETIRFDSNLPGSLPPGWTVVMTHSGAAPKWEVRPDASAPSKPNVLAQLSYDRSRGRFPMAIFDKSALADGEVSVKFKTMAGKADQVAGLVWRYRDPNNYYLVRANALEHNIAMYKVEEGKWSSLSPKGK